MTTPKPTHRDTCIYVHIYKYLMIQNINTYMYIIYIYLYIYTWPWLSPLRGWDSLTMTFTGKFVYLSHHFNLLQLYRCDLRVDREGWWFENSVSQSRVCLSAEGTKNVSWHWLSPPGGWDSLTMAFTGKSIW